MALDLDKLENVQATSRKTTARCPACAEDGMDEKGEHLIVREDGKFGCVLHPGAGGRAHRQRIFALVGIKTHPSRPKYRIAVKQPGECTDVNSGRFGRVFLTRARTREPAEDQDMELGDVFTRTRVTQDYPSEASGNAKQAAVSDPPTSHETPRDPSEASEMTGQPAAADVPSGKETHGPPLKVAPSEEERQEYEDSLPPMLFRPPMRSMNHNDSNFQNTPDGSLVLALHWWKGKITVRLLYADPEQHCFWDCEEKAYVRPPRFYMLVCEKLRFDPIVGFSIIDGTLCPF